MEEVVNKELTSRNEKAKKVNETVYDRKPIEISKRMTMVNKSQVQL